jgi:hypothetical protein
MKITHLSIEKKPTNIIVRNYNNVTHVLYSSCIINSLKQREPFEIGQWKIKYKNFVPKEYNYLK